MGLTLERQWLRSGRREGLQEEGSLNVGGGRKHREAAKLTATPRGLSLSLTEVTYMHMHLYVYALYT